MSDFRLKEALWAPYVEDVALACASFTPPLDTALPLAICARETWFGTCPNYEPKGPNGKGDGGHGRGLFQIDDRGPFKVLIPPEGQDWPVFVQAQCACTVLIDGRRAIAPFKDHPLFERAVVACYNSGPSNVLWALRNGYDPDRVTTPGATAPMQANGKRAGDYGADVLRLRDAIRATWPDRFPKAAWPLF